MAFWRLVLTSRVLNGWRLSCFVGQRHPVVLCSTWMVNDESRKRVIPLIEFIMSLEHGCWFEQIELVIRCCIPSCLWDATNHEYPAISCQWFTRFAMDGVALFTACCVALSSCPWECIHCSSWKLFLLYCWWAKSRTPQQVISLISMDIPHMTVFELFELFESSQLVTSVGCLQNQTSLVTETVVPKDLACLLHLLFPLLP